MINQENKSELIKESQKKTSIFEEISENNKIENLNFGDIKEGTE